MVVKTHNTGLEPYWTLYNPETNLYLKITDYSFIAKLISNKEELEKFVGQYSDNIEIYEWSCKKI